MATEEKLVELLQSAQKIAVVGLSDKPWRASNGVSRYMQQAGYQIIPVNPAAREVLGQPAFQRLEDVPYDVDVVNVFRRSEHVAELVDGAIARRAKLFWMQVGIRDESAKARLEAAGVAVVMDRCLMIEHRRLLG